MSGLTQPEANKQTKKKKYLNLIDTSFVSCLPYHRHQYQQCRFKWLSNNNNNKHSLINARLIFVFFFSWNLAWLHTPALIFQRHSRLTESEQYALLFFHLGRRKVKWLMIASISSHVELMLCDVNWLWVHKKKKFPKNKNNEPILDMSQRAFAFCGKRIDYGQPFNGKTRIYIFCSIHFWIVISKKKKTFLFATQVLSVKHFTNSRLNIVIFVLNNFFVIWLLSKISSWLNFMLLLFNIHKNCIETDEQRNKARLNLMHTGFLLHNEKFKCEHHSLKMVSNFSLFIFSFSLCFVVVSTFFFFY